jgi:hypothetical protein
MLIEGVVGGTGEQQGIGGDLGVVSVGLEDDRRRLSAMRCLATDFQRYTTVAVQTRGRGN